MSRKHWYVWMSIFLSVSLSVASCGTGSTQVSTVEMRTHYASAESESFPAKEAHIERAKTERFFSAVIAAENQRKWIEEAARRAAQEAQERLRARTPAPRSVRAPQAHTGGVRIDWDAMAQCESGGRWNLNSGNGYYGGLQFGASDWLKATDIFRNEKGERLFPPRADLATRSQQIQGAERWRSIHPKHIRAWPACADQLGYA